jgi:hypothetical protein
LYLHKTLPKVVGLPTHPWLGKLLDELAALFDELLAGCI